MSLSPPQLDVTLEAAFGADLTAAPGTWTWTDLTSRFRREGVEISVGVADEASRPGATKAALALTNNDAVLTPYNAASTYWPYVVEGLPLRITVNEGTSGGVRALVYVDKITMRWADEAATDCVVDIEASGIRRTTGAERSAMTRSILAHATQPIAWWPCEDGSDAAALVSGLIGGESMTLAAGTLAPAQVSVPGTRPLPDYSGGATLIGLVPGSSSTAWSVSAVVMVDSDSVPFDVWCLSGGTVRRWYIDVTSTTVFAVWETGDGASATSSSVSVDLADGQPHLVTLAVAQSGSDLSVTLTVDGTSDNSVINTWTNSWIEKVDPNPSRSAYVRTVGEILIYDTASPPDWSDAMLGYAGEAAHTRIARLCGEAGIPITTATTVSVLLGAQAVGTTIDLLDDAAASDLGLLLDGTSNGGFVYIGHRDRYNLASALTLSKLTAATAPTTDDQGRVTDMTVTRVGGSSASYRDEDFEAAHGGLRREKSMQLSLYQDADALSQASQRVHLGTVEEMRYPTVPFSLIADTTIVDDWLAYQCGGRVTLTGLPSQHGPGDVDVVLLGYRETIKPDDWSVEAAAVPYAPWRVGVVETNRVNTKLSTLTSDITSTATSLSITSTGGVLWTTAAGDFPMDIEVGGEQITLSGITGASSPQIGTVSARSVNGVTKAHSAGDQVRVWQPTPVAL